MWGVDKRCVMVFVKRPIRGFMIVLKKIGYSSRSFPLLSLFALFDRLEYWGDVCTVCETSDGTEN